MGIAKAVMAVIRGPGSPAFDTGKGLRIAVEGCCHGDLDKIYATLQLLEKKKNTKIDLLICCGDFQAVRNLDDLECLACPPKYRDLKSFYRYYTGQAIAPYPTLFIGGNHEASNYLWELYYGGWAAPNIYYMGHAGVINFGGARIAGLSGIYKGNHYRLGHYERPPYQNDTLRSAYHVRELEVYRLRQLHQPLDVFLSHDWPQGIERHGNTAQLLRAKPFLRPQVQEGSPDPLGSPPAAELLRTLQPDYWFSAHLHVKFAAMYEHAPLTGAEAGQTRRCTSFLALDKCLPGRGFLQVLELPEVEGPKVFSYDEEWLAVLRTTYSLLSLDRRKVPLPGMGALRRGPNEEDVQYVRQALAARGGPEVPQNFAPTAPGHDGRSRRGVMPSCQIRNPQTEALLEMLGLPYNLEPSTSAAGQVPHSATAAGAPNPEEISLDNPEEIDLDGDADDDAASDIDESPPDGPGPPNVSLSADADEEDSMFAEVEIHTYDPAAAANMGMQAQNSHQGVPLAALANAMQQRPQN